MNMQNLKEQFASATQNRPYRAKARKFYPDSMAQVADGKGASEPSFGVAWRESMKINDLKNRRTRFPYKYAGVLATTPMKKRLSMEALFMHFGVGMNQAGGNS